MTDSTHASTRIAMPSACGKFFFLYSSALPQTAHAVNGSAGGGASGRRWSHAGHCHAVGGRHAAGASQFGHRKRTITSRFRLFVKRQPALDRRLRRSALEERYAASGGPSKGEAVYSGKP